MLPVNWTLFMLGASLGSWLACMAERQPARDQVQFSNRSHCPHCQHPLRAWQLIPILGLLLQRGRCHDCQHVIPRLSTVVELVTGSLTLALLSQPDRWSQLPLLLSDLVLIFNSLTDIHELSVYPLTLWPPALVGLWHHPPLLDWDSLILICLLVGLYLVARYLHQFGMGDVEVLGMLACVTSATNVLTSLTLAAVAALIIFSCHPVRHLPFVPFLSWGFIVCTQLL
ncbi:prepilin peptidase [Lactiplantibacillus plajomi]|uniref:Prepilin peptidase n=1 Tax=Lactiplantibacillus plajomi TaxID=1457217 RepID=A0ABV6K231_9LACO|nr:A24 family peptidase [Lactiplantibacillus plajomi]